MIHIKGDLLEGDWDFAAHVANSHCVMGSGVAYFLRKKWPEVYQADLDFQDNLHMYDCDAVPDDKLGQFSVADLGDGRSVYNLYAMWGVGNNGNPLERNCSYDNLFNAIYKMADDIIADAPYYDGAFKVGIPWGLGCVRAGGSWKIVESILQDIEDRFPRITFQIYKFDPDDSGVSSVVISR